MPIFLNMKSYQNLSGKTEKISQYSVGSAPPSYFATCHVTGLFTPPWKTDLAGVSKNTRLVPLVDKAPLPLRI